MAASRYQASISPTRVTLWSGERRRMILCDVSVLLSAGMSESPHHEVCLARLEEVLEADGFAVSELILAAVVRIATNPRVWKKPASQSRAFDFVDGLRDSPKAVRIAAGPRHWRLFRDLATATGCRGAD